MYTTHGFTFLEPIVSSTKQQRPGIMSHAYIPFVLTVASRTCVCMVVLKADSVVLPGGELRTGPLYVLVEGTKIVSIQEEAPDIPDEVINTHLLTPGFVDLHTHGLGEFRQRLLCFPPKKLELYLCTAGSLDYFPLVISRCYNHT